MASTVALSPSLSTDLPPRRSPSLLFVRRLVSRFDGVFSLTLLLFLLIMLIGAPWIAPFDPAAQDIPNKLNPPSADHLLGTDYLGRDMLSRIIFGSRVALGTALPAVTIALLIGLLVGLLGGYVGGNLDSVLLVLIDTMQAFPAVILALAMLALLGPSSRNVVIVAAIAFSPGYARVVRAQVLGLKVQPFIEAEYLIGAHPLRIILRHLLPNLLPALIILLAMDLPSVITFEAGLSFLGLGVRPPTPSWGALLADGFAKIRTSPWPVIGAGLALMLTTLGFTLFGETLRDLLDPRLGQTRRG